MHSDLQFGKEKHNYMDNGVTSALMVSGRSLSVACLWFEISEEHS